MKKELTTLNETNGFKELTKEEMAAIDGGFLNSLYYELAKLYDGAGAAVSAAAAAGAAAIR